MTLVSPPSQRTAVGPPRRRRRRRWPLAAALVVATLVAAAAAALLWPAERTTTVPSQPAAAAADFVDSIGVNAHLHYTDTVYGERYADIIRPRLRELGVRHVRDGVFTYDGVSADTFVYRRMRELAGDGVRFTLITAIDSDRGERTDLDLLARVQRWTGDAIIALEGANEPDLSGVDDWAARTRALQRDLWRARAADPALRDVAIVGPSPAWEPEALGDLSSWADYGNWHPYPGGQCPACDDDEGFEARAARYRAPTGDAPLLATETGYHNAVVGEQDHPAVSERAAARYLPRLLFEHFDRGVVRTFLYELIDQRDDPAGSDREAHFGLLRNDGSRKPAFAALRDLVAVLDDPGPAFTPRPLGARIEGATGAVGHTVLQKRDGRHYLALWQSTSSYDTDARADLHVPPAAVTVTTATPVRARLFVPGRGSDPVRRWPSGTTFTVDVPDAVVLVELTP